MPRRPRRAAELPARGASRVLAGHFLAGARGDRLVLRRRHGAPTYLRGKGARRWPTAESVMADLHEIARGPVRSPAAWPASS